MDGEDRYLHAITATGGDGYEIEMALAGVAEARHDVAATHAALDAAHRFDPSQVDAVRTLYALDISEKREADALAALTEVARLDQHDRRAYGLLLAALVTAKRWDEAKRTGEAAIYVDVESAEIHVNYAHALSATGDHATAAYELESALLCAQTPEQTATTHALLAAERFALGDVAAARTHRDEALRLDPSNVAAHALKL